MDLKNFSFLIGSVVICSSLRFTSSLKKVINKESTNNLENEAVMLV